MYLDVDISSIFIHDLDCVGVVWHASEVIQYISIPLHNCHLLSLKCQRTQRRNGQKMSEAKSVSGFKPRSQATIVETLWALAEAGAILSMDPKISKPVLKKLTLRKNCGVQYSIPIDPIVIIVQAKDCHEAVAERRIARLQGSAQFLIVFA